MFDFDVRDSKAPVPNEERWDVGVAVLSVAVGLVPRRGSDDARPDLGIEHAGGVKPTASIGDALRAMMVANRSTVPLVDDAGGVVGAVTARDIVGWLRATLAATQGQTAFARC